MISTTKNIISTTINMIPPIKTQYPPSARTSPHCDSPPTLRNIANQLLHNHAVDKRKVLEVPREKWATTPKYMKSYTHGRDALGKYAKIKQQIYGNREI